MLRLTLLALTTSLAAALICHGAQPTTNPSTVRTDPLRTQVSQPEFAGGTLQEFADQLRPVLESAGIRLNVIQNPQAQLPSMGMLGGPATLEDVFNSMLVQTHGGFSYELAFSGARPAGTPPIYLDLTYRKKAPADSYFAEFDFKGGTITDLAEKIRSEDLGWTNIYVKPSDAEVAVPAFKVKNVWFNEVSGIVDTLTMGRCRITSTGSFLILGDSSNAKTTNAVTAILPLRDLLKDYKIEDINALVQTALKMRESRTGRNEKQPDMSLHNETSTLVVVGSSDQVKLVQEVIDALTKQKSPIWTPPPPAGQQKNTTP